MHIRSLIYLFILLHSSTLAAAQTAELDSILRIIKFKSDTIGSIFNYVAGEIEYDTENLQRLTPSHQRSQSAQTIVLEAIKRRKGVCTHYAALFDALLRKAGYECYVVEGYVKGPTKIDDKIAHVWNAVRIRNSWFLYDPTWSSGSVDNKFVFVKNLNDTWYKVPPEEFIMTHIPFDPIWQLLNPPVSNHQVKINDFARQRSVAYSFQDSIAADLKKPENLAKAARIARIKSVGVTNRLINDYVEILENNVSYNLMSEKLNTVSNTLNLVIIQYNMYISGKNKQFRKPQWSDQRLQNTIETMKSQMSSAQTLLETIKTEDQAVNKNIAELKSKVSDVNGSINKETEFVSRYLSTSKPLRIFKFYSK